MIRRRFGLSELVLLNIDLLMWGWIVARSFH
jgi:hypothetical protein